MEPSAATGPIPEAVSAAENRLSPPPANADAQAGRKILSRAFVMIGPDGHLIVELRGGRTLMLHDVVLRAKDYCGIIVGGDPAGARFCGAYGEVVGARPGDPPAAGEPDRAPRNPLNQSESR